MLKGVCCFNEVKDNLVLIEVLRKQIRNNFDEESNLKRKRCVAKFLVCKRITKYKTMSRIRQIASRRTSITSFQTTQKLKNLTIAIKDIEDFLSQGENSKQCAGKKETITKGKVKKSKKGFSWTL